MSARFDFRGMTPAQAQILDHRGWSVGCGRFQPGASTVKKMIARGLVVETEREVSPRFFVREYSVTDEVAAAWTEYQARLAARKNAGRR